MPVEIINKSGKTVARLGDAPDGQDDVVISQDGSTIPYNDAASQKGKQL